MVFVNDELKLFRQSLNGVYAINDNIKILHPTLGIICDTGELEYYNMVSMLTSTPSQMKVALDDIGVDYTKITDFELFIMLCQGLKQEITAPLFGEMDFSKLIPSKNTETDELVMCFDIEGEPMLIFDRALYTQTADYLRKMHGFERKDEPPNDEGTRKYLIERDRKRMKRQAMQNQGKKNESMLKPLISAMVNQPGFKYSYETVWDMPINIFNDAVGRIQKFLHYTQTMGGAYAGTVNLKEVNKDDLNWLGALK